MFGLSRRTCIWITVIHAVIVLPPFIDQSVGELGPEWCLSFLIYDTPVAVLLLILLMPTPVELCMVHPWLAAPIVFVLGALYWIGIFAVIRTIVRRLDQSGTAAIDERIRERQAKLKRDRAD